MGIVSLDHVGIAAPSAELPLARALGAGALAQTEIPTRVAIARLGPGERLEVVTPARAGSPIERFLERRGPGLHHVAFEVEGALASVLGGLRAAGLEPVGSIEPSSDGRPSVFLHPGSTGGVLVELVEGPRRG